MNNQKPGGLTHFLVASGFALRVNWVLAGCDGLALILTASVVFLATINRPVSTPALLVALAFPLLFAGQLWVIGILGARAPRRSGNWWTRTMAQMREQSDSRTFLFGSLPTAAAYALLGLAILGWFAAITAFPALRDGNPNSPMPGCQWPLNNHGVVTCVSESRYQDALTGEQRSAGGVLLFFFTFHFGVVADEIARRRKLG